MAIQRWDPLRDMHELQQNMNQLFEEALSHSAVPAATEPLGAAAWRPPTDLFEEFGRYVVRADLPGIAPADVAIQIEEGHLVLSGERKRDANVAREAYLRVERPDGRFTVRLTLPPSVDQELIKASHHNGVLEISLPKKKDKPASRIEISAN